MAKYLALTDLKVHLNVTVTTYDALLASMIEEAEASIDAWCRRSFTATTTTRYYESRDLMPNGVLVLGADLLTCTTLKNGDGTTIASADYWLEPWNATPKSIIRLKSTESWVWETDGRAEVTGTWGYSATPPDDIVRAVKLCVADAWNDRGHEGVTAEQIGDYRIQFAARAAELPVEVLALLKAYIRREVSW